MSKTMAATVALLCTVMTGTAVAGQSNYPTFFVKFKFEASTNSKEKFVGQIDSGKDDCVEDRKVVLFRKKDGDRRKVGSDKTNNKGKFSIGVGSGPPPNGKYFAQAREADAGNGGTCLSENSAKVTIN